MEICFICLGRSWTRVRSSSRLIEGGAGKARHQTLVSRYCVLSRRDRRQVEQGVAMMGIMGMLFLQAASLGMESKLQWE